MPKNIVLIVVFLLLTFISLLNAQISPVQRQGLIDFYNAMDGDNWINNSHKDSVLVYYDGDETPHYQYFTYGWKTNGEFSPPGTEGDWFGVYLGGEGSGEYITEIRMPNNNLSGELTLNLLLPFDSYFLKLNLSNNINVTGVLPNFNYLIAGSLRGFRYMNTLTLDRTSISGGFKLDGVSKLPPSLSILFLNNTNIIDDIANLDFQHLQYLQLLYLDGCTLTGTIPESIGSLDYLRELSMNGCGLSGELPASLSQVSYLRRLSLEFNALEGTIPDSWYTMTDLNAMLLEGNKLSGVIPPAITNMTGLYDSGLDFIYTGLYGADANTNAFIDERHAELSIDYLGFQTLPPTGFTGTVDTTGTIYLSWEQANAWLYGYYRLYESNDNLNWNLVLETTDKTSVLSYSAPWTGYGDFKWYRLHTVSIPHAGNANTVISVPAEFRVANTVWFSDPEYYTNWTLTGDFQLGIPQTGNECLTAFTGTKVLGTNLQGSHLANQIPGQSSAISPSINCSNKENIRLSFYSFSRFEGNLSDNGQVQVSINQGEWQIVEVINNSYESAWTRHWVDISVIASNQADVRIMFTYLSDSGLEMTGWNLDDIMLVSKIPMAGLYTIDQTGVLSNNFKTFTSAFEALNSAGVSNNVIIEVAGGQVFSEDVPPLTVKGNASAQIYISGTGNTDKPILSPSGSTANPYDAAITLVGADYVTFNSIDLAASGSNVEYGIYIVNSSSYDGSRNNVFSNCQICGFTQYGISSADIDTPWSLSGNNSENMYIDNTILNCGQGIYVSGTGMDPEYWGHGNIIRNCIIGNDTAPIGYGTNLVYGINATKQNNISIEGCQITNLNGTSATGIHIPSTNSQIKANYISGLAGSIVKGIYASGNRIFNNMISLRNGESTSTQIYGIELTNQYNAFVDFNSVYVQGGTTSQSACLILPSSNASRTSNNIFANGTGPQSMPAYHALISIPFPGYYTSSGSQSDANIFYQVVPYGGGIGCLTGMSTLIDSLSNWQSQTNQDYLSKTGNPRFVSLDDLHIRTDVMTIVEGSGQYLGGISNYSYIPDDIDLDSRSDTTPDIGADEGNFLQIVDAPYEPYALSPFDGSTGVLLDASPLLRWGFSWDNNHPVTFSGLYLSTDYFAVNDFADSALVLGNGLTLYESYSPAVQLMSGTAYYWRVVVYNAAGGTASQVFSFVTESIVSAFPYSEGFNDMMFPSAWHNYYSDETNGISGNNISPSWGGWNMAYDPQYIHSGENALSVNSYQMPGYYWLMSPLLNISNGIHLKFWLNFLDSIDNPTELYLMVKTTSGWQQLQAWNSPEQSNAYANEIEFDLSAYAGQNVRLAWVYRTNSNAFTVALDDVSLIQSIIAAPTEVRLELIEGVLNLSWLHVAGANHHYVYSVQVPGGTPTLEADVTQIPVAGRMYWVAPQTDQQKFFYIKAALE